MRKIKNQIYLLCFAAFMAGSFTYNTNIPAGWFAAGNSPDKYEMGIDKGTGIDGSNAATIKSIAANIQGFGTLMQQFKPGDKYLGKRIRLSGMLKSKDVSEWSAMWLRIDTRESVKRAVFDNMHDGGNDRSVKGTTGWKKYEIVLDVPDNATNVAFGVLLAGTGQVWFDNLKFEIVGMDVPFTGIEMTTKPTESSASLTEPVNLMFDK
jgi:hypothetical protein